MSEQKRNVQLSQCMIVKDEEKNIRQALSWGREFVCEQIVVDTGSTDRTVEIAEQMGAKVLHFDWCDDFAAAKNYAIDHASGEWIAFLDADEYFTEKDAQRLLEVLRDTAANREVPDVIRCAWVQIGENGQPFSISVQDRIFRNVPQIRYHGRIHEQLSLSDGEALICLDERKMLSIFHTGYALSNVQAKGKWKRNIRLLLREIEENPQDNTAWSYLGDAYAGEREIERAIEAYERALSGEPGKTISRWGYMNAGKSLLRLYANDPAITQSEQKVEETAEKVGYPVVDNPDVYFFLGIYHMKKGNFQKAYGELCQAFGLLDAYRGDDVIYLKGSLGSAYACMADICRRTDHKAEALHYSVLTLQQNRYQENILCQALGLLKEDDVQRDQEEETWRLLLSLYDQRKVKDILFLIKCIKMCGYPSSTKRLLDMLPAEVKSRLTGK